MYSLVCAEADQNEMAYTARVMQARACAGQGEHFGSLVNVCLSCWAGGELFEQLSAKGHYRERDAANIMRTLLQVCALLKQCCAQPGNRAVSLVDHACLKGENKYSGSTGSRNVAVATADTHPCSGQRA